MKPPVRLGAVGIKHDPRFNGWLAGISLIAAFPVSLGFALSANSYVALACFMGLKFLMTLHLGPIIALCYAQVPDRMRAMTSAAISMLIGIAGTGIGGFLVGALSDAFLAGQGDQSLRYALASISLGLPIGGVAAWMAARTMKPFTSPTAPIQLSAKQTHAH
jgi:MFS family permease